MNAPPPSWLDALKPQGKVERKPLAPFSDFEVWSVPVVFEDWVQPEGTPPLTWHETYGKTQVIDDDGNRSVTEIEIARRLRAQGYRAYVIDAFGAMPVAGWKHWTIELDEMPRWLQELCRRIRRRTGSTSRRETAGIPDVVAWQPNRNEAFFVEYKGLRDKPRPAQEEWMRAALREDGVSEVSLAVVQRVKQ